VVRLEGDDPQLATRLLEALRPRLIRATAPILVAVDGRSGAGKTEVAALLSEVLGGVPVVQVDDVVPGWDGLSAGVDRFVTGVLEPWAAGEVGWLARWDWEQDAAAAPQHVQRPHLAVVEGCGAGSARCRPFLSAVVWLEAPDVVRKERALDRDGDLYRPHWQRWADQEAALYSRDPVAERADVVVDTSSGATGRIDRAPS
jgi:para-aminobenzoate synthetase